MGSIIAAINRRFRISCQGMNGTFQAMIISEKLTIMTRDAVHDPTTLPDILDKLPQGHP
ncbi:MAG: hypothetical protein ACK58N_08020 [Synechocystis sp.]